MSIVVVVKCDRVMDEHGSTCTATVTLPTTPRELEVARGITGGGWYVTDLRQLCPYHAGTRQ